MTEEKISNSQFFLLVFLYTIGSSILILPASMAAHGKQDGWIAVIIGILIGAALILFYTSLAKSIKSPTFVDFLITVFGKWVGRLLGLIFSIYFFLGSATVLYYVGYFVQTEILPQTPIVTVVTLFAILILTNVRAGIENIGRVAEFLTPIFLFLFLLMIFFLIPEIKTENLQPMFQIELKSIIWSAITFMGTESLPLIAFLLIYPFYLSDKRQGQKSFLYANLLGGLVMLIITLLTLSIFGPDSAAARMYPGYDLAKVVNIGDFLQRIEMVIVVLWFITMFFKIIIYFYASILTFSQVIEIKDYRSLSIPFGILMIVFSLVVYPDPGFMQEWDSTVYIPYVITLAFLLPLIIWLKIKIKGWLN